MTTKQRLRVLVDGMTDEQAEHALRMLDPGYGASASVPDGELPAFVGSFDSGDGRLSERVDDLLGDGFGH